MEEEVSKLKSENYNLKCTIDRRILEFEANEEMIQAKNEAEKQKISQEKDDIISVWSSSKYLIFIFFIYQEQRKPNQRFSGTEDPLW